MSAPRTLGEPLLYRSFTPQGDTPLERVFPPLPDRWQSGFTAKLGGVDQYLFTTLFGAHGIAASDGALLWHFPFKFNVSASPSPWRSTPSGSTSPPATTQAER